MEFQIRSLIRASLDYSEDEHQSQQHFHNLCKGVIYKVDGSGNETLEGMPVDARGRHDIVRFGASAKRTDYMTRQSWAKESSVADSFRSKRIPQSLIAEKKKRKAESLAEESRSVTGGSTDSGKYGKPCDAYPLTASILTCD
jgi:hypothetical protein